LVSTRRTGLLAWAVLATGFLPAHAEAAEPTIPTVVKAEPAPGWDARFAGKEGWMGGDGVYSVVLGPKRVLWLFGDSLLGSVKDGQRRGAAMVNNTIGVQTGTGKETSIKFLAGKGTDGKSAAFFTPTDGKGWFWPQAAVRVGDRLFVFLAQVDKTRDRSVLGFKHIGQWLAVVENPGDEPEKWRAKQHQLTFAEFGPDRERSWGSAVMTVGEDLYVYGYDQERGKGIGTRQLIVARVPAKKLEDWAAWRFRTAKGWGEKPRMRSQWLVGWRPSSRSAASRAARGSWWCIRRAASVAGSSVASLMLRKARGLLPCCSTPARRWRKTRGCSATRPRLTRGPRAGTICWSATA
jgi:hypothetical protein